MKTALVITGALIILALGMAYVLVMSPVNAVSSPALMSKSVPDRFSEEVPVDVDSDGILDTEDTLPDTLEALLDAPLPVPRPKAAPRPKALKVRVKQPDSRVPDLKVPDLKVPDLKMMRLKGKMPALAAPPAPKAIQVKRVKKMSGDLKKIKAVIKYRQNKKIMNYGKERGWDKGKAPKLRRWPRPGDRERFERDKKLYPRWRKTKKQMMPTQAPEL